MIHDDKPARRVRVRLPAAGTRAFRLAIEQADWCAAVRVRWGPARGGVDSTLQECGSLILVLLLCVVRQHFDWLLRIAHVPRLWRSVGRCQVRAQFNKDEPSAAWEAEKPFLRGSLMEISVKAPKGGGTAHREGS